MSRQYKHGTANSSRPRCDISGCEKPSYVRGYCTTHYYRWQTHGDPMKTLYIRDNDTVRFWIKVNKFGPCPPHRPELGRCWEWTASRNDDGYGEFRKGGKIRKAHRFAHELTHGSVPRDKDLDHLCRNTGCVRPDHLRLVSNKQNCEHRGVPVNNSSGYRGVSWHKLRRKWSVCVTHNGNRVYGGNFTDVHLAGAAAKALRNSLYTHNDLDRIAS